MVMVPSRPEGQVCDLNLRTTCLRNLAYRAYPDSNAILILVGRSESPGPDRKGPSRWGKLKCVLRESANPHSA
jgi:hypothetical protein